MPAINLELTGKKIKEAREAAGMTVKDVAEKFGFASAYPVYKWQNGQSLPTLDNLVGLAGLFGVRMDDLIVAE